MSLMEQIASRPRGRPPKAPTTPVAAALAEPLPSGLEQALKAVEEARRAFSVASEILGEARSTEAKVKVDEELAVAQAALQEAHAQRDVAARAGDDDAPDDDAIKALEAAVNAAQAKSNGFAPRIEALAAERERRRQALNDADNAARTVLAPWWDNLCTAVRTQLELAASLIGEANVAWEARNGRGPAPYRPSLQGPGGEMIAIPASYDLPEPLLRASETLRRAMNEVTR